MQRSSGATVLWGLLYGVVAVGSCGPPLEPREDGAEAGTGGGAGAGAGTAGAELLVWVQGDTGAEPSASGAAPAVVLPGTGGALSVLDAGEDCATGGAAPGAGAAPATGGTVATTPPAVSPPSSSGGTGGGACTGECGLGVYESGCTSHDDCAPGLSCLVHPLLSVGACFPECSVTGDCPGGAPTCAWYGEAVEGYCLPNCDPREPTNARLPFTACQAGASCLIDSEHQATYCAGPLGAGLPGDFCQHVGDCAIGHTCQAYTCVRYCGIGDGDCDDLPRTTCESLAALENGEAFGICSGGAYGAPGLPAAVADLGSVVSALTVPDDFLVTRLRVHVSVVHDYCADLSLVLTAPDGTSLLLADGAGGGSRDCYLATTFDDGAPDSVVGAPSPLPALLRPAEPLAALVGAGSQGTWTLTVADQQSGDSGQLVGWWLTLW